MWKMPAAAKTPPDAAGEQVDQDLSQKALHSRGESATEAAAASGKQDPLLPVTSMQWGPGNRGCALWDKAGSLRP